MPGRSVVETDERRTDTARCVVVGIIGEETNTRRGFCPHIAGWSSTGSGKRRTTTREDGGVVVMKLLAAKLAVTVLSRVTRSWESWGRQKSGP
jgi:hypothetical protein